MIPIIDLHCDTIMALYQNKDKELRCNDLQIDVNKLKDGNYLAQVFAMFVYLKGELNPFKTCDEMIDLFYSELEKNKDKGYTSTSLIGKAGLELVYEDKVAPILTLNGSDVTYAFVNEGYSEKGFSAADNCIGDISNRVKVIGSVNTSVAGTYTLKYEVSDDAGNTTTKERKVIVSQRGQNAVTISA